MPEHRLEIKIVQAGRITGQYNFDGDNPVLEKIVYPEEVLPFDVGIVPGTLTPLGDPFTVLILGPVSHPIGTKIEIRLLGGLQRASGEIPLLLAVPTADERSPENLDQLDITVRSQVITVLKQFRPGLWPWFSVSECDPHLHEASRRYRESKVKSNQPEVEPDWKPIWIRSSESSFAEAERYTPAEYTFHELPDRFKYYVNGYLAPNERILFAVQRPAMQSRNNQSWLRRNQLQAGVLILTDQRLIHLVELVPPDSANIRYGYHTTAGILERLASASILLLGGDGFLIHTDWMACDGRTAIDWEMPASALESIKELLALLQNFVVNDPSACVLRRATPPDPPEELSPLENTAASDPKSLIAINRQFSAFLAGSLAEGEQARAWAYIPEWFNHKKSAQALVVTQQRVIILPDCDVNIPLESIATLEYIGSILESSLVLNYFDKGVLKHQKIDFPYPAQDAFRNCFEAARRCMAVLPISSPALQLTT